MPPAEYRLSDGRNDSGGVAAMSDDWIDRIYGETRCRVAAHTDVRSTCCWPIRLTGQGLRQRFRQARHRGLPALDEEDRRRLAETEAERQLYIFPTWRFRLSFVMLKQRMIMNNEIIWDAGAIDGRRHPALFWCTIR